MYCRDCVHVIQCDYITQQYYKYMQTYFIINFVLLQNIMYPLTGSLVLIIFTFLLSIYTCSAQDLVIHVDAINGEDTESCVQGKTPCATINMALKGINFNGIGNITLNISPGNYALKYGIFNNISGNVNSRFAIIGRGELETIVECDPSAGLNITSLYEVTIKSITFIACGFENQLTFEFSSYMNIIIHASPASLTFTSCQVVSVNSVTILRSNGSGIIMMDTRQASIIGCTVSLGYYLDSYSGSLAVGGIVHLTSDSNRLSITHSAITDNDSTYYRSDTFRLRTLSITHSNITDNNYQLVNEYCKDIQATGAIVVVGVIQFELDIHSCLIANNSRALFSYHFICNTCSYVFNSSTILNNQNASTITSYEYISLLMIRVLINDTKQIDSRPLIIYLRPPTKIVIEKARTIFSSTTSYSSAVYQGDGSSIASVCLSHTSNFSFEFYELEECEDPYEHELQPECIFGYDCTNIYSVCSVKEGECSSYRYSDNCFCYDNHYNETKNCDECKENYSVAINSPYLECVPCNSIEDVLKSWVLLIVLEFIPLTIMIALIAILNVNLNQGSLKAYILFCQLFTIPIPSAGYPSWIGLYNYTYRIRDFALLPFTIWNLGFISFPSCNLYSGGNECSDLAICISQNTTPLGAIVFWYVIAFYPFLLLASLYGYVIMYNRGNRCVVCTGRPVHRLLARFWRTFDIQPSLSHTVASVYMLCFTQLVAISLKLLQWNWVDWDTEYEYDFETVFFYDGSQKYFDTTHSVAFSAGLFVLLVIIVLPVTYLCVYPFKWFQKCFNKLKFKKDLLVSVTDVFIGPYQNGTNDTWDYRYFVGLAYALQFSQLILLCFPLPVVPYVYISFNGLYTILLILFRPYKRIIHSFTEVLLQIVVIGFSAFPIVYEFWRKKFCLGKDMVNSLWLACICFLYIFLAVSSIYCFVWILRKIKYAVFYQWQFIRRTTDVHQPLLSSQNPINEVEENDMEFADRLMNPQDYN